MIERRAKRLRRACLAIACALVAVAASGAASAHADFPWAPGGDPHDPTTFKLAPGVVPSDFNETNDWKLSATPEPSNPLALLPAELCGVRGASIVDQQTVQPSGTCATGAVNTAWQVSTGRPDVTVAVLDSGIEWNDQGAMTDLRAKVHLNQGELPAPEHSGPSLVSGVDCSKYSDPSGGDYNPHGDYDVNGDGVFNVLDYACDPRVAAVVGGGSPRHALRHGPPGFLTPEDLILAFSDGQDHDGNGFANDIAGWNFVDDNNDPFDDVQYGHGTGEALDSNAEANNGGNLGTCPNCMVTPLRVGESFIADANRFAQAVLYATDSGADIVQEALGTLNESNFARQAIEYSYRHGVSVIASAADEAAEHHNQPGALPDAIVVNSVTKYNSTFTSTHPSYLQFNGCTNFSTRVIVSVPSTSCSSEATGKGAGVAGLIYSAAENAAAAHKLQPGTSSCVRVDGSACVITPNEVRQLMGSGAIGSTAPADQGGGQTDDVNFLSGEKSCPTPDCTDPNQAGVFSDPPGGVVGPAPKTTRYPARQGFDEFYGYGRLNAYKATSAVAAGKVPPEAEITSPDWFQQIDPGRSSFGVDGYVNARAGYTCVVQVAPGGEPNNSTDFQSVSSSWCDGSTEHSRAFTGALASIDVNALEGRFPPGDPAAWNGNENGGATPQTAGGRPNTMPYAFTVRVVVRTAGGATPMTGEDRRQLFLHRDQDMLAHFPIELQTDGASAPLLADIDGDNRNELVVATSDGTIHAYRPDGSELPGWPVHTDSLPLHSGERAYGASDGVGAGHGNAVLGALAAGDLFHDGRIEVVADDNGGNVYAWDGSGNRVFHAQSNPSYSGAPLTPFATVRQGPRDRTEHGFLSSPVLADLDGSGKLDIVAASDDRHVYAWHPDGSAVDGFPVLVVDPDKVASVDATTNHVSFNANASQNPGIDEDQGKIVDTPAVARLDGPDKPPSIIVGTNEEYAVNTGDEGPINASGVSAASLGVVGQTGVLGFANGRVYVLNADGNRSGSPIRAGWPKKVGIIDRGLLPDVGEGINGSPVTAPLTCPSGGAGTKVGVTPDAGPAYVFNADGSSCYGQTSNQDNTLETDFSAAAGKYDTPAFAAVGYPAFGTLDGSSTSFFAPVTGLVRALDVALPEYQGGQDFIGGWNPTLPSKQYLPNFPAQVNDLQFLTGPVVGDILGGAAGTQEVVGGTASLDLAAFTAAGTPASTAWPKLTGDWTVATPALGSFGTLDTDPTARKDVVSITRSGTLSVYSTPASACSPSSSPRFHHDIANSGDYTRDAVPPGRPDGASVTAGVLNFTAPGNDLMCGTATAYQVVSAASSITPQSFAAAAPVTGAPVPAPAGTAQSFTLPAGTQRFVAIRAVDGAGNVGLPAVVDSGTSGSGAPSAGPNEGASVLLPVPGFPPGFFTAPKPQPSSCVDRRRFTYTLHHRRGARVVEVRVYVNGKHRLDRHGSNIRTVSISRLPEGRFKVKIVSIQSLGGELISRRTYRGCAKSAPRTRARRRHRR